MFIYQLKHTIEIEVYFNDQEIKLAFICININITYFYNELFVYVF